ncbi:hypothetical protein GETHLI_04460 [Geothrix limicola]|uniref:DUF4340 domain-containing protein n=1 Tax=Geothrix limicola TaxID=2927978 RepID=A0ABQ5QBM2_9BACT|nr:hypothetical protein [Geothrix limicola]GLH71944.1 hypothetical protein GETHLI_04460 [Geothrix limicola]
MKARTVLAALLVLAILGGAGYLVYLDTLIPVPLAAGQDLFVKANPDFGEDAARLEALMPAGQGLEAFLAAQSDLSLIEQDPSGAWAGQLASGLEVSRHGRRWRITLREGWRMQNGSTLDAAQVQAALRAEVAALGGEIRLVDTGTLDLRFKQRPKNLRYRLAHWRVPGSGPFIRKDHTLLRFDAFTRGKAGVAGLTVITDSSLMESRAWAEGLVAGRWAWAVFPGNIAPEDMAKVRLAPYDELRMKDGSVWFLSRRLRRLRPNTADWTGTRIFGAWKGAIDLPFDPLGL